MHGIEKRYERRGKARPCLLDQDDLVNLARIIQETFSRPEIDRYFRVSTTLNNTRVFTNSMGDFLVQKDLPDKAHDLSFWIEGWDQRTRFDKNVLLDFSRYSVQLQVEGTDPLWVYDKYHQIMKFLKDKTAWYWPVVMLEKFITFTMTLILLASLLICYQLGDPVHYLGKIVFLGLWGFLIFYDTRKIWPYSSLRLRGKESAFSKENVFMVAMLTMIVMVFLDGIVAPCLK